MSPSGAYSRTPLARKLGIEVGSLVLAVGAPDHYEGLLDPLPDDVRFVTRVSKNVDLLHLFTKKRAELEKRLSSWRERIRPDAMIWVSWPKKAAKVETDVTEDVVRGLSLPLGLVDVKVCAVDETWSGLKLVIRKELR